MTGGPGPRLADVLAACAGILEPVALGARDRRCHSVEIADAEQLAGAIVLGVDVGRDGLAQRCVAMGARAAAALVVRAETVSGDAELAARRAGLALLTLGPGISWAQAFQVLSSLVGGWAANQLETLIHEGNDLTALAQALAARLGNPLTIETSRGNVAAYSSHAGVLDNARRETILAGASPEGILAKLRRAGILRRIDASEEPVRFEAPELGISPRVAMAIRDAGQVIGYLWVMEHEKPVDEAGLTLVRQAAPLAAFHLLRSALEIDTEQRIRNELIRDIVQRETTSAELIAARATSIGIDATARYDVVLVDLDRFERDVLADPTETTAQTLKRRLLDVVGFQARMINPAAVCVSIADSVLVLLPIPGPGLTRAAELGDRALAACRAASPPAHASVGIGRPIEALVELPGGYEQAARAVAVAQRVRGGDTVVAYDSLGVYRLLARAGDAGEDLRLSAAVDVLQVYDLEHESSYCRTLAAFLDAFGDRARAASALNIHHNTLAYRLKRLQELTGLDLDDADSRLAAQLHLRALQLRHPPVAPSRAPLPGRLRSRPTR